MRFGILALLLAAFPAHAQMYKCVDARGVTHYSEKPLPGCKGRAVDIRPIPPVGGAQRGPGDLSGQDRDFRRRKIEQEQSAEQSKASRERRCTELRNQISQMDFGGRVFYVDEKGERVYVDDQTRARRLAELREKLRGC